MTNFSSKRRTTHRKRPSHRWYQLKHLPRWKRYSLIGGLSLLGLAVVLALWAVLNINAGKAIVTEALAAKQSLEYAQVAVATQEFERASKDLGEAEQHFASASSNLRRFKVYKIIPGVATQINAIDNLLQAGNNLAGGMQQIAVLGDDVFSVLGQSGDDTSLADIGPEQKRELLKHIYESPADLQGAKAQIELAILLIEDIPDQGLYGKIKAAVTPIKEQLPTIESLLHQAIPLAETLPSIVGYPEPKTYLFLLQNNRELRPTGGFIGTYGELTLDAGDIASFSTENIYNLDNKGKDSITEASPAPIAQHTSTQNWLMRDSNWSPDFPESARTAERKYHEEGGPVDNFDGVIAVTITFIESLLDLTGPITIDGVEFTSDKLFEQLEHQVEFAFYEQGISDADRKEVIGKLATELMNRLLSLPQSKFADLWTTFIHNVNSKQILVYVDDPITQSLVIEQNWAGEMKHYDGDFLMFVDANVAALKTDNVMERQLQYTLAEQDGDYYGEASMLYRNTGWFDGFHTRYRTYTRIYLPLGAEVVEASGFKTGDKTQGGIPIDPEVYEEEFSNASGQTTRYTVVAGFTSIEPHEEGTLRIKYRLPDPVVKQIKDGQYQLYIQKQSGTKTAHGLDVSFDIGKPLTSVTALDMSQEITHNRAQVSGDLLVDRDIQIQLK